MRAGLVARMAVLYDLLTGGPVGVQAPRPRRWRDALAERAAGANLVVRGARVLDPAEGIDARLDVRIDDGTIAEVAGGRRERAPRR